MATVMLTLFLYALSGMLGANGETLKTHKTNTRYFTSDSRDAIYMAGSSTWFVLYQDVRAVDKQRISNFLDWLQSWGHNYTRVWSFSFFVRNSEASPAALPYRRTGPGLANDGKSKFDLSQPNEQYFDLVRYFIEEIEKRGMYCSIMMFGSGISLRENGAYQEKNTWYPQNNINAETEIIKIGTDFYSMAPGLLSLQEDHVRRVVDRLNQFDNFAWEIINEAELPASKEWQYHMIRYIRDYEKTKPKQHLIIMSGGNNEASGILEDSPADIISPDNSLHNYKDGGPPDYVDKIVVNDTDHLWGFSKVDQSEIYRKWVWKTFLRGNHAVFMDDYDSFLNENKGQINSAYDLVRKNLGYTVDYAKRFSELALMVPETGTASTLYALVNEGKEYLVYFPDDSKEPVKEGMSLRSIRALIDKFWSKFRSKPNAPARSFTVQMRKGKYLREWFEPTDGKKIQDTLVCPEDGSTVFTIPAEMNKDVVVYLKNIADPE